jgi:CubicO group peptidase (beta-lactamase class C family)
MLFLLVYLAATPSASMVSAEPPTLAGHWEGAIEIPGMNLKVNIDFSQESDSQWKGDISIPMQKAKDLPLSNIIINGKKVTFAISGVPGDPTFKGAFSEDGNKITGDFTQGGQTFPFALSREKDPASKAKKFLAGFEEVVEEAIKTFKVPGLAISIVKDDKVIFAQGFGYRDIEQKLPMTADSLLAIGSTTKAFTTFILGKLVDEGKLDWDKPVRTYIPWFQLYDPMVGERITPRDLVTHNSGLPRHDLVWYGNYTASRKEFVSRLAYLQPSAGFREIYQYNNLMYLTAGYLIEVLTGKKWEEVVRDMIFEPLGMSRTNISVVDSQKDKDFAQPYLEREGKIEKVPFRNLTNMGPVGSINSSVNEMSKWIMVHLNNGKYRGRQFRDKYQPHLRSHRPTTAWAGTWTITVVTGVSTTEEISMVFQPR